VDLNASGGIIYVLLSALMEKDKNEGFRSLCPVATSLDVIGDKWTLLVLRDIEGAVEDGLSLESGTLRDARLVT
jgi:hypothetical protein